MQGGGGVVMLIFYLCAVKTDIRTNECILRKPESELESMGKGRAKDNVNCQQLYPQSVTQVPKNDKVVYNIKDSEEVLEHADRRKKSNQQWGA